MARKKTAGSRRSPAAAVSRKAKRSQGAAGVLGARDLAHFRDLLLAKRRELLGAVGDLAAEASDGGSGGGSSSYSASSDDPAESGWLCQKTDVTAGLLANERQILRDIEDALARIIARTYGTCEGTGLPIPKARLEARPWARYCIEYARQLERHNAGAQGPLGRPDPYSPPAEDDDAAELDDDPPDLPVPLNVDLEDGIDPGDEP